MMPLSLRVIENGAFEGCKYLYHVLLNDGLIQLGEPEGRTENTGPKVTDIEESAGVF